MRIRAIVSGVGASAAVLVVGWQLGSTQVVSSSSAAVPAAGSAAAPAVGGSTGSSGTSSGSATAPAPQASTPAASPTSGSVPSTGSGSTAQAKVSGTFDGSTAQTQYGPVQVEIVVSAGTITDVKALQLTDQGGRSVEISNYAAPLLRTEALSAQSAKIQSVSGATFTSEGYTTSLQSALDAAKL